MKKIVCTILTILLLAMPVYGDVHQLPNGSVQGLPQNLIVMDEDGNSPKDGQLYIYIPNMLPQEVYTKDVTIMNARDDAVYSIYMTATPNYNGGDIDLLNETQCKLYLDDKLIYQGLVNGDGTPNMQTEGIDLGGVYQSGESRKLHAEFVWDISDETQKFVDEYNDELKEYYGLVSFHWTFYAQIEGENSSSASSGGGGGNSHIHRTTSTAELTTEGSTDRLPPQSEGEDDIILPDGTVIHNDTEATTDTTDKTDEPTDGKVKVLHRIAETIIDKAPFIPEDVKTGYHSELMLYTQIAVVAFAVALVIVIVILVKAYKLRKIKRKDEST